MYEDGFDACAAIHNKIQKLSYLQIWRDCTYDDETVVWIEVFVGPVYDKVSDVVKVESDLPAKIWRLVGWFPGSLNWPLMHKLSKYVWYVIGKSQVFGRENLFSKKNT